MALLKPPPAAAQLRDVEDEPIDYLESRGIGMERMVEGYQHGGVAAGRGAYRDYIKVSCRGVGVPACQGEDDCADRYRVFRIARPRLPSTTNSTLPPLLIH
jgi:hypothetical protein